MIEKTKLFFSDVAFKATVLALAAMFSSSVLVFVVINSTVIPMFGQRSYEQRSEVEMGIRMKELDRRVTAIEEMKIGESLAELRTAADYNKALQLGILVAVLGILAERLANMIGSRRAPRGRSEQS